MAAPPPPPPPPPPHGGHCLGRFTMSPNQAPPFNCFVGTQPITQAARNAVEAIRRCRPNPMGFPSRTELGNIPGLGLLATGGLNPFSPLRPFIGDLRLLSETLWRYLMQPRYLSGAEILWQNFNDRDVQLQNATLGNMRQMENPMAPYPYGILPPAPTPAPAQQPATIPVPQAAVQPMAAAYSGRSPAGTKRKRQPPASNGPQQHGNVPVPQPAATTPIAPYGASAPSLRAQAMANSWLDRVQTEGATPERLRLFEATLNMLLYRKGGPGAPFELDEADGKYKTNKKKLVAAINLRLKKGVTEFGAIESWTALKELTRRGVVVFTDDNVVTFEDDE